jgi:hypothetical protein
VRSPRCLSMHSPVYLPSIFYTCGSHEITCFKWCSGAWSPIGSTGHCGHQWPIVPTPGDYDDGEIGGIIGRGSRKYSEKTCPSAALSTTNPTCCPDANPCRRGGKPATNRLSYGTATRSPCYLSVYPFLIFARKQLMRWPRYLCVFVSACTP